MTKATAVLLTLLGIAFAQIDRTCIDIVFNSETNTLSGKCQPRDNSGYIPSELDLNDCFGYDGTNITPTYHGNFAESCHGCEMFVAPDPWYGGAEYWIRCTCKGQSEKVAVPLEAAIAHEPIDELLESVYLGEAPIGKSVDALKWLLERKFDMKEQGNQPWCNANDYCDHFPEFLITILNKSPDRVRTEGICQMIQLLHSYGYSLPFHMNFASYFGRGLEDIGVPSIPGPLDVALRSHCPPELLGLVLRDYLRPLVKFDATFAGFTLMKRWAGKYRFAEPIGFFGEPSMETADQPWWKSTNVLNTIWGLFLDLMDNSTSWTEEYRGEAADVFGQKIKVLIKYQVLDQLEENMLRGIAESMRSMTTPTKASNIGVVDDRDSQCCRETLYRANLHFKSNKQHRILDIWDLINPDTVFSIRCECHRFNIDPDGNVYKM
ncbi:hypothetical protein BFJ71_g1714 [Fusarium oxysporum]|nr:hypothetical protein BFJ71_g1714 [Fusarium oxysporum]